MVRLCTIVCRSIIAVAFVLPLLITSAVSADPVTSGQPDARVSKTPIVQTGSSYNTAQTVPPRPELFAPLTSPPRPMQGPEADDRAGAAATVTGELPLNKGTSVKR